jgi:VIT1/CCC1 family predicted Fe2+/Mn2+ transporter
MAKQKINPKNHANSLPIATELDVYNHWGNEQKNSTSGQGSLIRQIILGGQDGLVNVLGLILGVAGATNDPKLIIIAGLAATAAESISMAAVAYTSSKAQKEHYLKEMEKEKWEMKHLPEVERAEIRLIYMKKGFRGKDLDMIVEHICSNDKLWLETMMTEELGLTSADGINPGSEALVVGFSSFIRLFLLFHFCFLRASTQSLVRWFLVLQSYSLPGRIKEN